MKRALKLLGMATGSFLAVYVLTEAIGMERFMAIFRVIAGVLIVFCVAGIVYCIVATKRTVSAIKRELPELEEEEAADAENEEETEFPDDQ